MLCETHKRSKTLCLLIIMLIFKKASEAASVLYTKKRVGIFFPPFAFQTWNRINIFFSTKECVSCPQIWQGYKEANLQRAERREVTDRVRARWKVIWEQGLMVTALPPFQRRQLDIISDSFSLCPNSIFQQPCGRSPVFLGLMWLAKLAMQVLALHSQIWNPAWHPIRMHSWMAVWLQNLPLSSTYAQCI